MPPWRPCVWRSTPTDAASRCQSSDAQVAASYRSGHLRIAFLWALPKVVGAAPFAAIGAVVHVIPYQLVKRAARRPDNEGMRSTVKLVDCFFTFFLLYVGLGIVVGDVVDGWAGMAAALFAPACGYTAVRMSERMKRIGGALEGFRMARDKGQILASVSANRVAVIDAVSAVLDSAKSAGRSTFAP
jgi:hypothetical protein